MIPKFENYEEGSGAKLTCPHCDSFLLHHFCIESFERTEDAESGTHVTVSAETVKKDSNMDDNPSERRNGLLIRFECEECGKESVMTIAQHKGTTLVDIS